MTAEQLKASLLQRAIQGKLVPQLDDEPPVDRNKRRYHFLFQTSGSG